jgi:hypothetical protein
MTDTREPEFVAPKAPKSFRSLRDVGRFAVLVARECNAWLPEDDDGEATIPALRQPAFRTVALTIFAPLFDGRSAMQAQYLRDTIQPMKPA